MDTPSYVQHVNDSRAMLVCSLIAALLIGVTPTAAAQGTRCTALYHDSEIRQLVDEAGAAAARKDLKQAAKLFDEALHRSQGEAPLTRSMIDLDLATVLVRDDRNTEALAPAQESLQLETEHCPGGELIGRARVQIAAILGRTQHVPEAIETAKQAVADLTASLGADDSGTVGAIQLLGEILWLDGQFPEAQRQIRYALDYYRAARQKGLAAPDLMVEQLSNDCLRIAVALAQDHQDAAQVQFYLTAMTDLKKDSAPDSSNFAQSLVNVAEQLVDKHLGGLAEPLLRRAMDNSGHDLARLYRAQYVLGRALMQTDRLAEAHLALQRSLDGFTQLGDHYSLNIADALVQLGQLASLNWESDVSLQYYTRAYELLQRTAPNGPESINITLDLAEAQLGVGRGAEAQPLLARVLAYWEAHGADQIFIARAAKGLGRAYSLQNDPQKAAPYFDRAYRILREQRGDHHIDTADVALQIAANEFKRDNVREADRFAIEAISVLENSTEAEVQNAAAGEQLVGAILLREGLPLSAATHFRRSLADSSGQGRLAIVTVYSTWGLAASLFFSHGDLQEAEQRLRDVSAELIAAHETPYPLLRTQFLLAHVLQADKSQSAQTVVRELKGACRPPKGTESPENRKLCDELIEPNGRLRPLTLKTFARAA